MPKLFKTIIIVFISVLIFSCSEPNEKTNKLVIAVSISPYKYLVGKIAGNEFEIISSIPAGATPHHFEPTPKLVQYISQADYYFAVGRFMEFENTWLEKVKGIGQKIIVYDLSKGIQHIDNDPHVWLSPSRLKIVSQNILNALLEIEPEKKQIFENNYNNFVDSLTTITSQLDSAFAGIKNRILLVYHGSWIYFADDFGFTQISIESGSKTSSAKEFKEILNIARESEVPVLFVDPQHSKATAEVIAQDLGIKLETINPLPENLLQNFYEIESTILRHYK